MKSPPTQHGDEFLQTFYVLMRTVQDSRLAVHRTFRCINTEWLYHTFIHCRLFLKISEGVRGIPDNGAAVAQGEENDNSGEEEEEGEDAPPPALPPRPPNLALPAPSTAVSICPTATSSTTSSSSSAAAAATQHPPHIGNSYSSRLEESGANGTGNTLPTGHSQPRAMDILTTFQFHLLHR